MLTITAAAAGDAAAATTYYTTISTTYTLHTKHEAPIHPSYCDNYDRQLIRSIDMCY
jgi:hypothetical protein